MKQLWLLYRIWRVWRQFPALRFGQLLENAGVNTHACPLFYAPDDTVIKWLDEFRAGFR